jgi:hypothetical protein
MPIGFRPSHYTAGGAPMNIVHLSTEEFARNAHKRALDEAAPCPECEWSVTPENWASHFMIHHPGVLVPTFPKRVTFTQINEETGETEERRTIYVDKEFQALIPPQTEDESIELEASLKREGCRDALVVWAGRDILIDGHHRYKLCQKLGIEFRTIERKFETREDVVVWMVRNQLARRNITSFVRAELADRMKDAIEAKAEANKKSTQFGNTDFQNSGTPVHTDKEIAKFAGVSHDTIHKSRKVRTTAPDIIKQAARSGELSVDRAYKLTRALEDSPADHRDRILELAGDNDEKVRILNRLYKSQSNPETNGTFDEIMRTGGFAYGHDMDKWCDFAKSSVEEIQRALRSLSENHALVNAQGNGTDFNYKRDSKIKRVADEHKLLLSDFCQTPAYALDPLLPYLDPRWRIWEPAAGEGLLVEALLDSGFNEVQGTDILTDQNFFKYEAVFWDVIVTNPPYSLKFEWLERCYALGQPFALLVPVEMLGAKTAQELMQKHGFEIMLLDQRVDFKMPNKGWDGAGSQFPVMWLCWKLLPQQVVFGSIEAGKKAFKHDFK